MDAYASIYTDGIKIRNQSAGAYIMHLAGNVVMFDKDQTTGSYSGNLLDAVEGRRFVELIGQEGGKDWRLFEEEQLASGQRIHLGE
jgi:hypothetical protein